MMFAAALLAAVVSAQSQHCLAPRAWEARLSYFDPVAGNGVRGTFSYDAVNQRRFINEMRFNPISDGTDSFFHIWALWKGSTPTLYSLNRNTSQCLRAPITAPWRDYGVYPNATYRRQIAYGTMSQPGAGVVLNRFFDVSTDSNGIARGVWESEFTAIGCIPYRHYYINMTDDARDFREDHWLSTTLGIRDPTVFNPPSQCLNEAIDVDYVFSEDPNTWNMAEFHKKVFPKKIPSTPAETVRSSADPVPCVSPPSWEALSYSYDPITQLRVTRDITYDGVGQREYISEVRHSAISTDDDNYYQIWALWNANPPRLYVYHINTTICTVAPLNFPWREIGVNPNATFWRADTIGTNGLEGAGVEINTFVHRVATGGVTQTISFNQVTAVGCIPVRQSFLNFTSGTPSRPFDYTERHVNNVLPKFVDPNVFTPPSSCRSEIAVQSSIEAPHDSALWSQLHEMHKANVRAQ